MYIGYNAKDHAIQPDSYKPPPAPKKEESDPLVIDVKDDISKKLVIPADDTPFKYVGLVAVGFGLGFLFFGGKGKKR